MDQIQSGDVGGAQNTVQLLPDGQPKQVLQMIVRRPMQSPNTALSQTSPATQSQNVVGDTDLVEELQKRLDKNLISAHPMDPSTEVDQRIAIARLQTTSGNLVAASKSLIAARTAAQKVSGDNGDVLLSNVAAEQARARDYAEALNSVHDIQGANARARAFADISITQVGNGDVDSAKQTLAIALTAFNKFDNASLPLWAGQRIIYAEVLLRDIDAAKKLAFRFSIGRDRRKAVLDLAVQLEKAGDAKNAVGAIDELDVDPKDRGQDITDSVQQVARNVR
jgi:hypothetical protein